MTEKEYLLKKTKRLNDYIGSNRYESTFCENICVNMYCIECKHFIHNVNKHRTDKWAYHISSCSLDKKFSNDFYKIALQQDKAKKYECFNLADGAFETRTWEEILEDENNNNK